MKFASNVVMILRMYDIIIVPQRSLLDCVIILSFSVVMVGFTKETYEVQERNATVVVCVRVLSPAISCPLNRAFNLTLLITDQTAGNYT